MYEYRVHTENSPKKFKEACKKIEENFPNTIKRKLLIDVDGSTIQTFTEGNKDIDVFDDYDVGAVYINSEIDLGELFEQM
ncbi:MAG: hypothetical protein LUD81_06960 [Clostridiales bacterium]|nr:hypothetical protein [Clostridiales bacterium]